MHSHPRAARRRATTPPPIAATGERVRLISFHTQQAGLLDRYGLIHDPDTGEVIGVDDNLTVPPGTEGTVDNIDDAGTVHVHWDNGARLGLLHGYDQWEPLRPTP